MKSGDGWMPNTDTLPGEAPRPAAATRPSATSCDSHRRWSSGKLISKAMLAEATTPASAEPYGFGFAVGRGAAAQLRARRRRAGMNGELRIFPELGYVVVGLSNLDPPAASKLVDFFTLRMPDA